MYYLNIERGEQRTLECVAHCPDPSQHVTLADIRKMNFKVIDTQGKEISFINSTFSTQDQSCSQGAQNIHSNLTLTWNKIGVYLFQCVFRYHRRVSTPRLCWTKVVIINVTEAG